MRFSNTFSYSLAKLTDGNLVSAGVQVKFLKFYGFSKLKFMCHDETVSNINLISSSLVMSLYILLSCFAFVNFSSSASDFSSFFSSSAISGLKWLDFQVIRCSSCFAVNIDPFLDTTLYSKGKI